MGRKKAKDKRKSELKTIFFIALIAATMFIISTYAWFTTQRNVSITNLSGIVDVADGLEVSLNAKEWYSELVLGGDIDIMGNAYEGHHNISPKELVPVSTLGLVKPSMKDIPMIRGRVEDLTKLYNIVQTDESLAANPDSGKHNTGHAKYPGYFAFDLFLKNTSRQEIEDEILQLNYNSSVQIIGDMNGDGKADGNSKAGLQNTVRVGFAEFGGNVVDGVRQGVAGVKDDAMTILEKTGAIGDRNVYMTDIAIWEPNSNDHVQYIVDNNNSITWDAANSAKYDKTLPNGKKGFDANTQMPTFAVKQEAATSETTTINDIYKWDGKESDLQEQVTLQTTKRSESDYRTNEGVKNLLSTSDNSKSTPFSISPNSIVRLRIYVWLEGQDVDCINYASHGGGVTVNIGLVKGSVEGTNENDI